MRRFLLVGVVVVLRRGSGDGRLAHHNSLLLDGRPEGDASIHRRALVDGRRRRDGHRVVGEEHAAHHIRSFTFSVAVGRRLARAARRPRHGEGLGPGRRRLGRLPAPPHTQRLPRGRADVADGGRRARALPSQHPDPESLILMFSAGRDALLGVLPTGDQH